MQPKPIGPYSLFRLAGDIVFISGQLGVVLDDQSKSDVAEQTRTALLNVKKLLDQLELELSDVVKATIFTTRIDKFQEINAVWEEFFTNVKVLPSRSTVGVASLPKGAQVEIEVIAHIRRARSLLIAGCHQFLNDDFVSAREYFEKAWKSDKKSIYRSLSKLSTLCEKLNRGVFSKRMLKDSVREISRFREHGISSEKIGEMKMKLNSSKDAKAALELLKDFIRSLLPQSLA